MSEKARIDRTLIATLRESARPLRPEASLTALPPPAADDVAAAEPLQATVADLVTRLEVVEERLDSLDRTELRRADDGHVLFVPGADGYTVVERDGPPPRPGDEVAVDGATYRAASHRHSPFPADRRPCVVVEPADV